MMKTMDAEQMIRRSGPSVLQRMSFMVTPPMMPRAVLPTASMAHGFPTLPNIPSRGAMPFIPPLQPGPWNRGAQGFNPFFM